MTEAEARIRAQELLGNPIFSHVFDRLEQDVVEEIVLTCWEDKEKREHLCTKLRILRDVRNKLKRMARDDDKIRAAQKKNSEYKI